MNILGSVFNADSFELLNILDIERLYNKYGEFFIEHIDGNFAINSPHFGYTDYFGSVSMFYNFKDYDVFFDKKYNHHIKLPYYHDNEKNLRTLQLVFKHLRNNFVLYEELERYRYLTSNLNIIKLPGNITINKDMKTINRRVYKKPESVFINIFEDTVIKVLKNYKTINLCLSGGLDSRLLYAILKSNNISFRSFTWNTDEGIFVKKNIDKNVILVNRDTSCISKIINHYTSKKYFLSDYLNDRFIKIRYAVGELLLMDKYILSQYDGVFIGGWGRNEIVQSEHRSNDVQAKEIGHFFQFNPIIFNSNILMLYLFGRVGKVLSHYTEKQFQNEAMSYIDNKVPCLRGVPYVFNNSDNTISFY